MPSSDTSGLPQNSLGKPYPRNPLPGTARNRPHLSAASVSGLEAPGDTNRSRSASDAQLQPVNGRKGSQSAKNFWRPNGLVKRVGHLETYVSTIFLPAWCLRQYLFWLMGIINILSPTTTQQMFTKIAFIVPGMCRSWLNWK